jgi:integrase
MASLHNRSGVWYATFSDSTRQPRQRRLSLKTRSRRTAERLLARLDEAYREGAFDPWTQAPDDFLHADRVAAPKRVGEAVELYLAHVAGPFTETTFRTRAPMMRRFAAEVGPATYLERLTPQHVEAFVVAGGAARSTQGTRLVALKSFCSFCRSEGMLRESPAHRVETPKRLPRLPRAVTDGELEDVLEHLPEGRTWTAPVFRFAALTGLRVGELARLRWADVDEERRLLRVEQQKNGKAQTQPFPRAALMVLAGLPRHSEYVFASPAARRPYRNVRTWTNDLARAFKLAREAAGLTRTITPHGLRHRYCTKLAEAGANAFTIAAAARHADLKTSQHYVSISNRQLRAELDRVFP